MLTIEKKRCIKNSVKMYFNVILLIKVYQYTIEIHVQSCYHADRRRLTFKRHVKWNTLEYNPKFIF